MEDAATKIVNGDELIYLMQGSKEGKETLMNRIQELYGGAASISDEFLDPSSYKDDEDDYNELEDMFLDLITLRILTADFLFIHVTNSKRLSASRIKEIVHDDFFQPYYYIISPNLRARKRKLVIVSDAAFDGSIFETQFALNARCKVL